VVGSAGEWRSGAVLRVEAGTNRSPPRRGVKQCNVNLLLTSTLQEESPWTKGTNCSNDQHECLQSATEEVEAVRTRAHREGGGKTMQCQSHRTFNFIIHMMMTVKLTSTLQETLPEGHKLLWSARTPSASWYGTAGWSSTYYWRLQNTNASYQESYYFFTSQHKFRTPPLNKVWTYNTINNDVISTNPMSIIVFSNEKTIQMAILRWPTSAKRHDISNVSFKSEKASQHGHL